MNKFSNKLKNDFLERIKKNEVTKIIPIIETMIESRLKIIKFKENNTKIIPINSVIRSTKIIGSVEVIELPNLFLIIWDLTAVPIPPGVSPKDIPAREIFKLSI